MFVLFASIVFGAAMKFSRVNNFSNIFNNKISSTAKKKLLIATLKSHKNRTAYGSISCKARSPTPFFSVLKTSILLYWRFWKRLLVHREANWQRGPLKILDIRTVLSEIKLKIVIPFYHEQPVYAIFSTT